MVALTKGGLYLGLLFVGEHNRRGWGAGQVISRGGVGRGGGARGRRLVLSLIHI